MENIIHLFLLIPLAGFIISLLIPEKREEWLSIIAFSAVGANLLLSIGFTVNWAMEGFPLWTFRDVSLYHTSDYNFFIDFYFDKISATYLLVGTLITFMVVLYSRYYMHKESGFKRFFNTLLFFYTGYLTTVLSGNFETLFIGWEILGISSFLLIAFYRLRYLPVKNALKVFTIYRIGDVGIILAMWLSHHLWHENVTFMKLNNYALVDHQLMDHTGIGIFISLMLLLAALAKSAQLPFSAWLPRAMEGPTPSSAIFYGSLSVHIGAFLLLRSYTFWEHQITVRVLMGLIGLSTAIVASIVARVQSTIKSQIAYSSIAQIGIIFIEIAAGFEVLALIHFSGNAFLRTYQLLVSPSVVTYLIREQFYHYTPDKRVYKNNWFSRIKSAVYLLSLREWYLEQFIFKVFFKPLKNMRTLLGFLTPGNVLFFLVPACIAGFYLTYNNIPSWPGFKRDAAIISAFVALLMVSKAYNERSSSRFAWLLVVFANFFVALSVSFNEKLAVTDTIVFLSGVMISGLVGYFALAKVRAFEHHGIGLNSFHGLVRKHKQVGFLFLLACLGLSGFPITATFIGEDLILTHIHQDELILATLISITFIISGIAALRMYARVFLGKSTKNYQHRTDLTI